ncbi:hypothetical protein KFE98_06165 [bacterium SCSIO 12741]|nr:hypothetical protein KFE98_06165 [bacterium SCSIO 12741]
MERQLPWKQIISLGALNVALGISWIAYHEYQPHLLESFGLTDMARLLIWMKAIVLVCIPPLAGWIADRMFRKGSNFFLVFAIGIAVTAMIFMVVATLISIPQSPWILTALPVMIAFWLISMNIFISPANSLIERFTSQENLPLVMGILILASDLSYALEPLIVGLVNFLGPTLTFITGGVLVGGSGYWFLKSSTATVAEKTQIPLQERNKPSKTGNPYLIIIAMGMALGLGKGLLMEFIPSQGPVGSMSGSVFSFLMLGVSAVAALLLGLRTHANQQRVFTIGIGMMILGGAILINVPLTALKITGAVIVALGFSASGITGLPLAFQRLRENQLILGTGLLLGSSEIISGILEILG